MPTTGGNDWNIVFIKFLKGLLFAFIGVAIPYAITFLETEELPLPAEYLFIVPVVIGLLQALQNAWKHRTKTV